MKLLAIDTSTLVASAAVVDGATVLSQRQSDVSSHSDNLLVIIDEVLAEAGVKLAELDAIAIGLGPGSFTGLRIGMSSAKGLAYACGKPLYGVSSLAALAMALAGDEPNPEAIYVPVLDARRSEVFAGFYRIDNDGIRSVGEEAVLAPELLAEHVAQVTEGTSHIIIGGDATELYAAALDASGEVMRPDRTPCATQVAAVCLRSDQRVDILVSGAPVYIRPSEAEIKFPKGNTGGTFSRQDE